MIKYEKFFSIEIFFIIKNEFFFSVIFLFSKKPTKRKKRLQCCLKSWFCTEQTKSFNRQRQCCPALFHCKRKKGRERERDGVRCIERDTQSLTRAIERGEQTQTTFHTITKLINRSKLKYNYSKLILQIKSFNRPSQFLKKIELK